MKQRYSFDELPSADLIIDSVYEWGKELNISAEPINRLLPGCGNAGGFRICGKKPNYKFAALYSDFNDPNWPDQLDVETGLFVYYGDNKQPGKELHSKRGNNFLRTIFDFLHTGNRQKICPVFIFTQGKTKREVIFRGLAAPGKSETVQESDLVAIWKTTNNARFQNYRSLFTILNIPVIKRDWINDLFNGDPFSENCPLPWKEWVEKGRYVPLEAPRTIEYRSVTEQLPSSEQNKEIVQCIIDYFSNVPYEFEKCAVRIANMMLGGNIIEYTITRRSKDGGRDAVGKYRLGMTENSILLDFSLEAKCYSLDNGVGVHDISRLISRLRHRHFGIFVTTSFVNKQAYCEIKEDEHPVIIVCAEDIAKVLKANGYATKSEVLNWLSINFPLTE